MSVRIMAINLTALGIKRVPFRQPSVDTPPMPSRALPAFLCPLPWPPCRCRSRSNTARDFHVLARKDTRRLALVPT